MTRQREVVGLKGERRVEPQRVAVRDDGEAYAAKLAEAGVPVTCVRYMGVLHTFYSMRGTVPGAALAQRQVADALRAAVAEP